MELAASDAEREQVRQLALTWLQRSTHLILGEAHEQAQALLQKVWTITHEQEADLASRAARHLAWMLDRQGELAESAVWLGRAQGAPQEAWLAWPSDPLDQAVHGQYGVVARVLSPSSCPSPGGGELRVLSLGRFALVSGGRELPHCRSLKAVQMLRYLLTREGRRASRDELTELFWPNAPLERAAHNLHVVVNLLRRHIDHKGESYIRSDCTGYQISATAPLHDDSGRFRERCLRAERDWRAQQFAAAERAYGEAIALYTGDYVVDDPDMAWQVLEQQTLLSCYLTALERQGQLFSRSGRDAEALELFRRLLARDCYREDIHRALIACYHRLGRRSEALEQYRSCAAVLNNDLGIVPMAETTALYQALLAGEHDIHNNRAQHFSERVMCGLG